MIVTAYFVKVKGESLNSLYKVGDQVQLEDGSAGVIKTVDENQGLIDIEMPDNPEVAKMQLKAPQNIETPLKRV